VKNNQKTGLDEPSRILLNRIHTIDKNLRLIKKLGKVDNKTWNQVCKDFMNSICREEIKLILKNNL
jgi:mRNA-degrading endonuclease toxin of MazEF toxin-antitoxin module